MQLLFSCILGLAAGIFLTFFYRQAMVRSIERRRAASPTGKAAMENVLLSPFYIWFVRLLGIIAIVGSSLALWIVFTGSLPFGMGN